MAPFSLLARLLTPPRNVFSTALVLLVLFSVTAPVSEAQVTIRERVDLSASGSVPTDAGSVAALRSNGAGEEGWTFVQSGDLEVFWDEALETSHRWTSQGYQLHLAREPISEDDALVFEFEGADSLWVVTVPLLPFVQAERIVEWDPRYGGPGPSDGIAGYVYDLGGRFSLGAVSVGTVLTPKLYLSRLDGYVPLYGLYGPGEEHPQANHSCPCSWSMLGADWEAGWAWGGYNINGFYGCNLTSDKLSYLIHLAPEGPDLAADSNNDGEVDDGDELLEYDEDFVGALLPLNDDDDDDDGIPDYEDLDVVGEDDLEPLVLSASPDSSGQATVTELILEALEGAEHVRIWEDSTRSTEVSLPKTFDYSELPVTYQMEGVGWGDTPTVLRLAVVGTPAGDPVADTLQVYSSPLTLSLPPEIVAEGEALAVLTGLPDDTDFALHIYRNGYLRRVIHTRTSGPSAVLDISIWESMQWPGTSFRVDAVVDDGTGEGALVTSSENAVVVPGPADWVWVDTPFDVLPADEHTTLEVTAEVEDGYGNPVADGTPVFWELEGGGAVLSSSSETVGGIATAVLQPGFQGGEFQSITAEAGTDYDFWDIDNVPVAIAFTTPSPTLEAGSGQSVPVSVTVAGGAAVADGTPITWFTQRGTISGDAVVTGGQASATLTASGGASQPGTGVVGAFVANNVGTTTATFTAPATGLQVGLAHPVLIGDATADGSVSVEQIDGTTTYPYFATTTGTITGGTPNGQVAVGFTTAMPHLSIDGAPAGDPATVFLDGFGNGTFTLASMGTFTDAAYPDAVAVGFELTAQEMPPGAIRPTAEGFRTAVEAAARGGDDPPSVRGAAVKKSFWGQVRDLVKVGKDFVWGSDNAAGVTGDLVLGSLPVTGVYTDGRDLVRELARLWPGGDNPDWAVAAFATAGLGAEVFPVGANTVLNGVKTVLKNIPQGSALREGLFRYFKDLDLDAILKAGPLMETLTTDGAFRTLASDALVRNADDFARLVTLFHRLDSEDTAALMTRLYDDLDFSAEEVLRAARALGDEQLVSDLVLGNLRSRGKLEVAMRGAARGGWAKQGEDLIGKYQRTVSDVGGSHPGIVKFDEFADTPGSGRILKQKQILDQGVQDELDVARLVRSQDGEVTELAVDLRAVSGTPGDIDVVSATRAVEVKGGQSLSGLEGQLARLNHYAAENGKAAWLAVNASRYPDLDALGSRVRGYLDAYGMKQGGAYNVIFFTPAGSRSVPASVPVPGVRPTLPQTLSAQ